MDSSNSSKNLNARMTSEEMISKSSEWTLGCDNALLNRLKDFSNSLVSQAEGITKECDTLANDMDLLQSRVESVTNEFLMLANTQYVENVVEEFEERNPVVTNKSPESRVKTKAEKEAELLARMKEAIQIGLKSNSDHRLKSEATSESQELKFKRSHLIGTPKFFSSKYCGLVDENKATRFAAPDQGGSLERSTELGATPRLQVPGLAHESESDQEYPQGFTSSGLVFRREGSLSSDDLSFGRVPVSTSSSSNGQVPDIHPQTAQPPSEFSSSNKNTSSNLVDDLSKVLRSRMPPPQIDSDDSEDDFKAPPPGQGLGRKLFAEPEEDDDFFGSSSMYPANRYIDNDDDDFFDPPPKPAASTSKNGPNNFTDENRAVPQVNSQATPNELTPKSPSPVQSEKATYENTSSSSSTTRPHVQANPALDFSAVINQIKSTSHLKEKVNHHHESENPTKTNPVSATGQTANVNKSISKPAGQQPPTIAKIEAKPKISRTESHESRKLNAPPAMVDAHHRDRKSKVKQSIFDDSDSDDMFSSASSTSSKLKDGKSQNKDNLFTASSRSLSSTGGGSSLFGGDEPEDTFREKVSTRASNDSLPNDTVKSIFVDNHKPPPPKIQNTSKANVKKSIFEESDSDDDLFSSKRSKVIGKPATKSIFQEPPPPSVKPTKQASKGSALFDDIDDDGDLFSTKSILKDTKEFQPNQSFVQDIEINTAEIFSPEPPQSTVNSTRVSQGQVTEAIEQKSNDADKQKNQTLENGIETSHSNPNDIFEPISARVNRLQSQEDSTASVSDHNDSDTKEKIKPSVTKSNSFVKNAALNLKINPLALIPGAKPPSKHEEPDVIPDALSKEPELESVSSHADISTSPNTTPSRNRIVLAEDEEKSKPQTSSETVIPKSSQSSEFVLPKSAEIFTGRREDPVITDPMQGFVPPQGSRIDSIISETSSASAVRQRSVVENSAEKVVHKPIEPKKIKNSVFDDSDSDGDLFASSAKTLKKPAKASSQRKSSSGSQNTNSLRDTRKSQSLFGDDDDDSGDIFAGDHYIKPTEPISKTNTSDDMVKRTPVATQVTATPQIESPTPSKSNPVAVKPSVFDDSGDIFARKPSEQKEKQVAQSQVPSLPAISKPEEKISKPAKVKNSIFDDSDSGDDLFSSSKTKTLTKPVDKPKKDTPSKSGGARTSLFADELDDDILLFSPRKPSEEKKIDPDPELNVGQSNSLPDAQTGSHESASNSEISEKSAMAVPVDISGENPEPGMTNVKLMGLNLKINPQALLPGSKPSTPTGDEKPCSFNEMPTSSEHLLRGVVKTRAKITKPRRLPTRRPKSEEAEGLFGPSRPEFEQTPPSSFDEPDSPGLDSNSDA